MPLQGQIGLDLRGLGRDDARDASRASRGSLATSQAQPALARTPAMLRRCGLITLLAACAPAPQPAGPRYTAPSPWPLRLPATDEYHRISGPPAVAARLHLRSFGLRVFADCTATVTSTRTNISSVPEPLLLLYNRVADNRAANLDPCVRASAVRQSSDKQRVELAVSAPHGAGELLIALVASADRRWVTFQLSDLSRWHGDAEQRHVVWPRLCPVDMCPGGGGPSASTPFVGGAFEGFRGAEGRYLDSAGYFTLNSVWQQYNVAMNVKDDDRLAYTLAPTADLPSIRAAIATEEAIPPPSPDRAKTWLWLADGVNETNLADSIAYGKQLGVEVLFFTDFLSNQGDYLVDRERWPSGLAAARAKIEAAGLHTGLHMLSSWATTCYGLDAWVPPCPDSVSGWARKERCPNYCAKSRVSEEHPELFVPQGPAPHQYFWPNTAGTWYCHLQPASNFYGPAKPGRPYPPSAANATTTGDNVCHDMTRLTMAGGSLPYGAKNASVAMPFDTKNDRCAKTSSGQT